MHGMAMASWFARQRSRTVRDPVGQPMPAWHPSNGASRSVVGARTAERGRGGIEFSPTAPVLYFSNAEEGTKEGDDEGVPSVSQRGEKVMSSGLLLPSASWAKKMDRPQLGQMAFPFSSSISFLFYFVFPSLLFVANLVRV